MNVPTSGSQSGDYAQDAESLIKRIAEAGYDHIEAEMMMPRLGGPSRYATIYVWSSFARGQGRAFGGEMLTDALLSAAIWAEDSATGGTDG